MTSRTSAKQSTTASGARPSRRSRADTEAQAALVLESDDARAEFMPGTFRFRVASRDERGRARGGVSVAVRVFVMGERGAAREPATAADLADPNILGSGTDSNANRILTLKLSELPDGAKYLTKGEHSFTLTELYRLTRGQTYYWGLNQVSQNGGMTHTFTDTGSLHTPSPLADFTQNVYSR